MSSGDDLPHGSLPADIRPGELVSLVVWVPARHLGPNTSLRLQIAGQVADLIPLPQRHGGRYFTSDRLRAPGPRVAFRVLDGSRPIPEAAIDLYRWKASPGSATED